MKQRVFVRVIGFNDVERHALNSMFRLSQDTQVAREWSYEPWLIGSPAAARLALIDGSHPSAGEALAELEALGGVGMIWVGSISPAKAWRSFQRPLRWNDLLRSMDEYFSPDSGLDVDFGGDTWPSSLDSSTMHLLPAAEQTRVLVADADLPSRMYLRSKLTSVGLMHLDEAETTEQAMILFGPQGSSSPYGMVFIDLNLPGVDVWRLIAVCSTARLKILTREKFSLGDRFAAKLNGCKLISKPFNPNHLNALVHRLNP